MNKILSLILMLIVSILLGGLIAQLYWNWFMPEILPDVFLLSFRQGVCVSLLLSLGIHLRNSDFIKEKYLQGDSPGFRSCLIIVTRTSTLVFGYLIHLLMTWL